MVRSRLAPPYDSEKAGQIEPPIVEVRRRRRRGRALCLTACSKPMPAWLHQSSLLRSQAIKMSETVRRGFSVEGLSGRLLLKFIAAGDEGTVSYCQVLGFTIPATSVPLYIPFMISNLWYAI